jgi:hypothetical protein
MPSCSLRLGLSRQIGCPPQQGRNFSNDGKSDYKLTGIRFL